MTLIVGSFIGTGLAGIMSKYAWWDAGLRPKVFVNTPDWLIYWEDLVGDTDVGTVACTFLRIYQFNWIAFRNIPLYSD
ncbi:hypothetical protein AVEN_109263-1 [Araneus ventricosus]|uniref:Uncharacterized protein n=1 Tax=Araneus ventricosus TaxID=182803 RepID=A0A4Y1ZWS9_ARAVE|nr:hypothetical protein AVEN_109263-1 [Araneus ventricosus]